MREPIGPWLASVFALALARLLAAERADMAMPGRGRVQRCLAARGESAVQNDAPRRIARSGAGGGGGRRMRRPYPPPDRSGADGAISDAADPFKETSWPFLFSSMPSSASRRSLG